MMKYKILLTLFIISLLASIALSVENANNKVSGLCVIGGGCDLVSSSEYASTLGISNSYYGIAIFSFLTLVTANQLRKNKKSRNKKIIIHSGIIIGSLIATYFIYLQALVINAYCKYCLVVEISLLLSLITMISFWKE